jgi:hypothetical protein
VSTIVHHSAAIVAIVDPIPQTAHSAAVATEPLSIFSFVQCVFLSPLLSSVSDEFESYPQT